MKEQFNRFAYKVLYRYMCRLMKKRDRIKQRQLKVQRWMEWVALRHANDKKSESAGDQVIGL